MKLFESRKEKFLKNITFLIPLFFFLGISVGFFLIISRTSDTTLKKEQSALQQTLENGAVRTYALKGQYPENLEELLTDYHITYDRSRFVIDYVPNGSNLFPSISVLILSHSTQKEGTS